MYSLYLLIYLLFKIKTFFPLSLVFLFSVKDSEFRGYMCGYVSRTEIHRIRTTIKFGGPSGVHSETGFCSSLTKVVIDLGLPPNITHCSDDRYRDTFSVDVGGLMLHTIKTKCGFLMSDVVCTGSFTRCRRLRLP